MLAQAIPPPAQPCDGVKLDGAIVGAGTRGVVLVHESGSVGLCGWWPYAVRLANRGLRAMVFDLRCYGSSGCPVQHVQGTGTDTAAAVAALRKLSASFGRPRSLVVLPAPNGHGWDLLRTPVTHVWSPFERRLTRFLGGR
jgi:predicted alpha/beta hydrolase